MEVKEVFCDILTPCTLQSLGCGYYMAKYKLKSGEERTYYTYKDSLFLTFDEAVKNHNKIIKKSLSGIDKFVDDLKNRVI